MENKQWREKEKRVAYESYRCGEISIDEYRLRLRLIDETEDKRP